MSKNTDYKIKNVAVTTNGRNEIYFDVEWEGDDKLDYFELRIREGGTDNSLELYAYPAHKQRVVVKDFYFIKSWKSKQVNNETFYVELGIADYTETADQICWDSRTLLKCMYGCTDWGCNHTCPSRPGFPGMEAKRRCSPATAGASSSTPTTNTPLRRPPMRWSAAPSLTGITLPCPFPTAACVPPAPLWTMNLAASSAWPAPLSTVWASMFLKPFTRWVCR